MYSKAPTCTFRGEWGSAFAEEELDEGGPRHFEMRRHVGEDAGERPDPQGFLVGDRDVGLPVLPCREPPMAAGLTGDGVAQDLQRPREPAPGEIPGQPHAAMTSSRTWWSRISLGAFPSSK